MFSGMCKRMSPRSSLLLRRFVFRMVSKRCERETRVTGDKVQGTIRKGKEGRFSAVSPLFSFPPSFVRQFSSGERRLGTWQFSISLT